MCKTCEVWTAADDEAIADYCNEQMLQQTAESFLLTAREYVDEPGNEHKPLPKAIDSLVRRLVDILKERQRYAASLEVTPMPRYL